ncbi:hypothetical protein KTE69_12575 [Burkholderia multivorans]|uniref:hypothetical protein n=1 Tax=Burkholderia multivorans TaxID=87883 RepID=UPI001131E283|nr:hypothetical protein [Burkholderia multivorans]MBU9369206.1 hypothetical protein [Burkholderia multivorans]MBU9411897.1 hypothetical protein [Burkholderia multivorans]UXZ86463.1 hypothetical protein NUJ31_27315 [Burkholderia multivorans]HEM7811174.1 hypothetical protein [Burkholderia multivorans]HEM7817333.1 hypothetical protein [Burkholderia multivorans]
MTETGSVEAAIGMTAGRNTESLFHFAFGRRQRLIPILGPSTDMRSPFPLQAHVHLMNRLAARAPTRRRICDCKVSHE